MDLGGGRRLKSKIMNGSVVAADKVLSRRDLEEVCRGLASNARGGPAMRRRAGVKGAAQPCPPPPSSTATTRANPAAVATDSGGGGQLSTLDAGVKLCARKYNECKAQTDRLEEELGRRTDQHAELEREATVLGDMVHGNNPEAKKIAKLTGEIEGVNEQSDAKLRYRLQLNFMHHRQRKNSVALDAHMGAMSGTLSSAERERQQCEKMLGEVESSLTGVTRELDATAREMKVEQSERHTALAGKQIEASNAERLEAWRHERESSRRDLEQSLGGTYRAEKDKRLNRIRERENEMDQLNKSMEMKAGAFGTLEESFTHVERATGVNSLVEMVEKFTHYQEHLDHLSEDKGEAEDRLNYGKKALDQAHDNYDAIKANGFGDTELNREIIDDINSSIAKERVVGKVVKSTNVRLESVLVGLRQGGMGLYQRLIPFHPTLLDGDAPNLSESSTASAIQAAYDTLEMLKVTEQILKKMLDSVGGMEQVTQQGETEFDSKESTDALENPNLGENNCRIKPKASTPRSFDGEGDDTSGYFANAAVDDPKTADNISSRVSMKTCNEQQAGEARRRGALEEKQRKQKEREANGEASTKTAIKKMQAQATSRMAQHSMPIGLPHSVSIRDDPMTKAHAFLTEMPCLD